MPASTDRIAYLEAEILTGLIIHDSAARREASAFRALQKVAKEGSPDAIAMAEQTFRHAQLVTYSYKKALSILTDELGYAPRQATQKTSRADAASVRTDAAL